jgi:hypothetical protein
MIYVKGPFLNCISKSKQSKWNIEVKYDLNMWVEEKDANCVKPTTPHNDLKWGIKLEMNPTILVD